MEIWPSYPKGVGSIAGSGAQIEVAETYETGSTNRQIMLPRFVFIECTPVA